MSYRPQLKTSNGMKDFPLDAETVKGSDIVDSSGKIKSTKIPDLDASKITSGTVAPERLDISKNLNLWSYGNVFSSGKIVALTIEANTYYTLSYVGTSNISIADGNWDWLVWENTTNSITFRSGTSTIYVKFNVSTNISNIMLNVGSIALPYMPYIQTGSPILLWENSAPNDDFGGSSVLSYSEISLYKYIIIEYKLSKTNGSGLLIKARISSNMGGNLYYLWGDEYYSRSFSISDNNLTFTACYNNSNQVNNNRCIPITIYGTNNL